MAFSSDQSMVTADDRGNRAVDRAWQVVAITSEALPVHSRYGMLRGLLQHVLQLLRYHSRYLLAWMKCLVQLLEAEADVEADTNQVAPVLLLITSIQRRMQEELGNGGAPAYRPPTMKAFQEEDLQQSVPEIRAIGELLETMFGEINYRSSTEDEPVEDEQEKDKTTHNMQVEDDVNMPQDRERPRSPVRKPRGKKRGEGKKRHAKKKTIQDNSNTRSSRRKSDKDPGHDEGGRRYVQTSLQGSFSH